MGGRVETGEPKAETIEMVKALRPHEHSAKAVLMLAEAQHDGNMSGLRSAER